MKERIQKIIASRGVASRRSAEAMIEQGRVSCNGIICKLGDTAEENDIILIFDEVINPAKAEMEQQIYNAGLEDFSNRYGEKLNGYNDKLRPIEGEDFDIMKQAYDGYNSIEGEKPDEALYIDELVKIVDKQLDDIRAAIGAPADAEVSVTQDEDGETKVEVDGQEVNSEAAEPEVKDVEEKTEEEIVDSDDEEASDPEELAALEKELLKYAK